MDKLRQRLQKLRDLQAKKHSKFLETQDKAKKYKKDSFRLIWKIERTKEKRPIYIQVKYGTNKRTYQKGV